METRLVELSKGRTLEVQCTEKFLSTVKEHFELVDDALVTDEHIKNFFLASLRSALNKL